MEFISKYNLTFLLNVDRKYNKKFRNFDEYSLFLFELNNSNDYKYYLALENDLREYCKYQQERKNNNGKSKI